MPRTKGAKNKNHLTTQEKKLRGTFNVTKDRELEKQEKALCEKFHSQDLTKVFRTPSILKNKEVRKLYKKHINTLLKLNYLAEIDKKELDSAYFALEKAIELENTLAQMDCTNIEDSDFDFLYKRYSLLYKKYSETVQRYLVSPQSRLRFVIDNLTVQEKEQNIVKQQNVMEKLINGN